MRSSTSISSFSMISESQTTRPPSRSSRFDWVVRLTFRQAQPTVPSPCVDHDLLQISSASCDIFNISFEVFGAFNSRRCVVALLPKVSCISCVMRPHLVFTSSSNLFFLLSSCSAAHATKWRSNLVKDFRGATSITHEQNERICRSLLDKARSTVDDLTDALAFSETRGGQSFATKRKGSRTSSGTSKTDQSLDHSFTLSPCRSNGVPLPRRPARCPQNVHLCLRTLDKMRRRQTTKAARLQ